MIKLRRITINLLLAFMIATPLANSAAVFTEDLVDTDAARSKIPRNTRVFLPPEVAEVMKLSRAGVGEDVMLSYIQKSPSDYMLSASQIVYLRDLGVSDSVIKAMVEHRTTPGATTAQSAASSNVNTPPAPAQVFIPAPPPLPATVNNQTFFQFLSPYGKWLDVPGSGWSWQPSVAVLDSKWQPYANNGNWVWSDMGWYWNSGYSWGWAPFHYGRWSRDTRLGWLWHPDLTWAPAWVTWRQSSQYVGWAPLPPGSAFVPGTGWIHNGTAVGARYAFGLVATDFEFVPYNQLLNRNWQDYKISASMLNNVFAQTSATNNFMVSSSGRIINVGVSPLRLQLASGSAWRQVTVIDREAGAAPSINVAGFTEATPASVSYPQTSSGMTPIYIVANNDTGLGTSTTTSDTTTTTAGSGTTGSGTATTSTDTTGAGSTASQNGLSTAAQSTIAGTAAALATGSSGTTTANSVTTSRQNQNSYGAVSATPWLAANSSASSPFSPVVQTTAASQNTTVNSLALATSSASQSSSAAGAASRSPYGPVNASSAGAVSLATTAASRSPYGPVNQSSTTTGNSGNQALVTSATSTSSRSLNPFAPIQQTSTTIASGNQALVQASSGGVSAATTSSASSASPVAAVNSPLAQSVPQVQTVTSGSIFNSGSTFPSLPGAPTLPAATTLPGAPTSISVSPVSTALRASGAAVSAARSTLSLRR